MGIAATRTPGPVPPRPALRAQLTPIVATSPFEDDAAASTSGQGDAVPPDGTMQNLASRPNVGPQNGDGGLSQAQLLAQQRKQKLLADMTGKLQEILKRLGENNLDEQGREKYQALAQSITGQCGTGRRGCT